MSGYRLSLAAFADLQDIREAIAGTQPAHARRIMGRFERTFERLARHPEIGHQREDIANVELLVWPVYAYLIIYRASGGGIDVVRVLHAARDIDAILDSDRGR